MHTQLTPIFRKLTSRRNLTRDETRLVFELIMSGAMSEPTMAAVLGALVTKGESVDEIVGAAEAMRARVTRVRCGADCIDTCGTGGDGVSTFNASTTAAIIAAAAGATVAKHGNRSTTRVSGSTEVLTQLGIDTESNRETVEQCLASCRIGYLNAQQLHPAMKYAAPVRAAIPGRTTFNLLGPITNPAGARRQLVGVPRPELLELIALALRELGAVHVWVVHGFDGLCDLSVTGTSKVVELRNGTLRSFEVLPEDAGLQRGTLQDLIVDSPAASADVVRNILTGKRDGPRDHALLNAGAALVVAGLVEDLAEGVSRATQAIDSGSAFHTLERWRTLAGIRQREAEKGTS